MSRVIKCLSDAQSETLVKYLDACCEVDRPPYLWQRDRLIILLMLDAGLRVSEVCRLTIGLLLYSCTPVVDLVIPIEIGKGKRSRVIPLSERLKDSIRKCYAGFWLRHCGNIDNPTYLQAHAFGGITVRQIQRIVGHITFAAIGESYNPHALRHTFATRMMHLTDMRTVQTLLGHASLTSTQVYTHPSIQDLRNAINKTNGA